MNDNSKTVYEQLRDTIWTSFITLIPNIAYVLFYCCRYEVEKCLTEIGTIFPTTVVIAAVIWEVLDVSWFSRDKTDYKAEGRAEGKAEGKAEGREEITSEVLDILKRHNINGDALKEIKALPNNNDKG